jgi:hypothetical protein
MKRLHKEFCEVCGCKDSETLHHHHIVERKEIDTCNHPMNLAVLCSNCHHKTHHNIIEIIGVYPSTNKFGRKLIYKKNGIPNVPGIEEPYFVFKPKQSSLSYLYEKETKKAR